MIPRILISISILACTAAGAAAQREAADRRTVSAYFGVGGTMLGVDDLNAALAGQGYTALSERFFSLGAGAQLVINQAIVAAEGHALLAEQASSTNGEFAASLSGGYGLLSFGYLAYEGESLDLYPMLGVGWGGMTLDVVDRAAAPFDDVLADPRRGVELDKRAVLLNISLGGDYVFEVSRGRRRGPLLGLRFGYNYAPVEPQWELDGTPLIGGPEFGLTGPFVRIMLGFGGRGPGCC